MNKKIVFHIGYYKTGTTWLQKQIFPNLPGVHYIGRRYEEDSVIDILNKNPKDVVKYIQENLIHLLGCNSKDPTPNDHWMSLIASSSDKKYNVNVIRWLLEQILSANSVNLISHESLCLPRFRDRCANRIYELTTDLDTKIVITIRKQTDLIFSRYCHDINQMHHFYPFTSALNFNNSKNSITCNFPKCKQGYNPCFCQILGRKEIWVEHFNFYKLCQHYIKLFGQDNILILCFERMFDRDIKVRAAEFTKLYDFIKIDVSSQQTKQLLSYPPENQTGEKFITKSLAAKLNGSKLNHTINKIKTHFEHSNFRLDKLFGLNLNEYDYYSLSRKKLMSMNHEFSMSKNDSLQHIDEILRELGIVQIPNFLDSSILQRLKEEFFQLLDSNDRGLRSLDYPSGKGIVIDRLQFDRERFPLTAQVFGDPWMAEITDRFLGKPNHLNFEIFAALDLPQSQWNPNRKSDPSIVKLHYDKLLTLKFYLYLEDTTAQNGALECVPGSHTLTREMANRHLRNGGSIGDIPNQDIPADAKPIPIEGKAGTLIIFTTDTFHRAGCVSEGQRRLVMRGHSRTEPMPSFGDRLLLELPALS